MFDAGTDNEALLADPFYLGMRHKRLRGDAYYSLLHEFIHAVHHRWPNAVIQFEDFSSDKAMLILETYRDGRGGGTSPSGPAVFNDDIQGTAAVTVAALLVACRSQPQKRLSDQRIVVLGAGSAGIGVASGIVEAMVSGAPGG